ncbi:MAG TPA: preprotein translocase subunit SecE [Lacipirellulaceae bacterium]|nr:preprotein translocase subunit SecE [Lacipirellulaceae bacterium]
MANETSAGAGMFQELFRFGFYKRSQGRIARQSTFYAFAVIVALGAWTLSRYLGGYISDAAVGNPDWTVQKQRLVEYGVPLAVLAVGLWASFRVVQMPAFADFLISVEGEMNKVSWPSRTQLFRASLVVILVIFFMAGILYGYDLLLRWLLNGIDSLVSSIFG